MARLKRQLLIPLLVTLALACVGPRLSSRPVPDVTNLSGTVKASGGAALEGVGVSAREASQSFTTTVYTDAAGRYSFPQLSAGQYKIWAQAVGFEAAVQHVTLGAGPETKNEFVLKRMADYWKQLSGPEMVASLPGNTPADMRMKQVFANVCTSCHPASFTLQNRFDAAGWNAIVTLMERITPVGYAVGGSAPPSALTKTQTYVIESYKDELVAFLTKVRGPDSPSLNLTPLPRPSGDATRIVVTEYDLPRPDKPAGWVLAHNGSDWSEGTPSRYEGRGPHDVVVDAQGIAWFADDATPGRTLGRLDPRTGKVTEFVLPNSDHHVDSTHALAFDPDGNLWAADDTAGLPLEFIPGTEKFKTYPGPSGLPKVGDFIATDPKGNAWAPFADGVAKLDPRTGKYAVYPLLTKGKSTYGIDSDKDGNIWIAQLTADKVAFIDGETGEASEVVLNPLDPHGLPITDKDRQVYAITGNQNAAPLLQIGPRRLAADKTGDYIWVAEHFANRLAKINIHTKQVTEYDLPHAYMQPYAIAVGKDHMVWATVITADRVIKFDPFTEKFTEYELPTRGTEARHIFADNRTDPPTIWIPYDRTNKIARLQLRAERAATAAGN